jgi:phenylacetate-CoA ligase
MGNSKQLDSIWLVRARRSGAGLLALALGQRWSRPRLLKFQGNSLVHLINHCFKSIPFYRKRFDEAGIAPSSFHGLQDLKRLPLTSRSELQLFSDKDFEEQGLNIDNLVTTTTSGSTGEPLSVRRTQMEQLLISAFRARAIAQFGSRPWHRRLGVVYCPEETTVELSRARRLAAALAGPLVRKRIHCLWPHQRIIDEMLEFRPQVLGGFPSILTDLAMKISGRDSFTEAPLFVVTGAEKLSDGQRDVISQAFQAPIRDTYGAVECRLIASECPETGNYHLCEDAIIAEVLRDGRTVQPGEDGEIVVTALYSYAMPIIRYRLGDLVTKGPTPCPCGSPFSSISNIRGRILDSIITVDGTRIHASVVDQHLRKLAPWVRRYQVIQERLDCLTIRTLPFSTPLDQEVARLEQKLTAAVGHGIIVRVQLERKFPAGDAGKFRLYLSRIQDGASKDES